MSSTHKRQSSRESSIDNLANRHLSSTTDDYRRSPPVRRRLRTILLTISSLGLFYFYSNRRQQRSIAEVVSSESSLASEATKSNDSRSLDDRSSNLFEYNGARGHVQDLKHEPMVYLFKILPMQTLTQMSRVVCRINSEFLKRKFVRANKIDLSECVRTDVRQYSSIQDIFVRQLKPGVRPIDSASLMASPCDGAIVEAGQLDANSQRICVKGRSFSVAHFLNLPSGGSGGAVDARALMRDPARNELFYAIVYLAPHNYHHFHAPCAMRITERTHIKPETFIPLSGRFERYLSKTLTFNERIVYTGETEHGYISYTPVSALLVGTIKVDFDPTIKPHRCKNETHRFASEVRLAKGDHFGYFLFGSTVVLVFEAARGSRFAKGPGALVKAGERLM